MAEFIQLLVDPKVHQCSPASYAGSTHPKHWVPGVFANVDQGETLIHVVEPTPSGDVRGCRLKETAEGSIFLSAIPGMEPADFARDAVCDGVYELTDRPEQLRAVLGHVLYWAESLPCIQWLDESE